MKKFLRVLLICLSFVLCFAFVACDDKSSTNGTGNKSAGLQYKTYDGVLTVVGYVNQTDEDGENITTLSASDFEENVGAIKAGAFSGNNVLKEIEIPDTVETIGDGAFAKMTALTTITLPFVGETADASGENALFGYVFGKTEYDGGVVMMQQYDAQMSSAYYIPETLRTVNVVPVEDYKLPDYAFNNVIRVSTITLGSKVMEIGNYAFSGAYDILEMEIPSAVKKIGNYAFSNCTGMTEISFATNGKIKEFGEYAFANCNVKEFTIPEGVDKIGSFCFSSLFDSETLEIIDGGSKLVQITLPSTVKVLPSYAFYKCEKLTTVVIAENNVEEVRTACFEGCVKLDKVGSDTEATISLPNAKVYSHAFKGLSSSDFSVNVLSYDVDITDAFGE